MTIVGIIAIIVMGILCILCVVCIAVILGNRRQARANSEAIRDIEKSLSSFGDSIKEQTGQLIEHLEQQQSNDFQERRLELLEEEVRRLSRFDEIDFPDDVEDVFNQPEEPEEIELAIRDEITYDDFGKLQFAVGEILSCEEVKKSRKLLCSQVKIGNTVRQILSGIKGPYSAQEMVGKKVMVLVNLKPAKMAGLTSEGMILCAEGPDGTLALMTPEKDLPSGSGIS